MICNSTKESINKKYTQQSSNSKVVIISGIIDWIWLYNREFKKYFSKRWEFWFCLWLHLLTDILSTTLRQIPFNCCENSSMLTMRLMHSNEHTLGTLWKQSALETGKASVSNLLYIKNRINSINFQTKPKMADGICSRYLFFTICCHLIFSKHQTLISTTIKIFEWLGCRSNTTAMDSMLVKILLILQITLMEITLEIILEAIRCF